MSEINCNSVKNGGGSRSVPNAARWPQNLSQRPRGPHRRWMGSEGAAGGMSWKIRSCPRKIAFSQNTLFILVQFSNVIWTPLSVVYGKCLIIFNKYWCGQRLRGASVRGKSILSDKNPRWRNSYFTTWLYQITQSNIKLCETINLCLLRSGYQILNHPKFKTDARIIRIRHNAIVLQLN